MIAYFCASVSFGNGLWIVECGNCLGMDVGIGVCVCFSAFGNLELVKN
jgi:hypothetical protein